jgi:peptide/nickel transport system substrate-binding protein
MKRSRFLPLLYVLLVMAMVLSACGPAAQAPAAEEAPAAGEAAAPAAEAPAAVELQGPIPYPEAPIPPGGGGDIVRFPLDQILTYKALDSYSQPEWMDKFVEDGTLPPVEERLPKEPQVLLTSAMSDGIGVYGGVWRDFSAVQTEGWNLCAGQTQGWFGINYIYSESLVKSGPIFMRSDAVEPLPNLAKSWEWSDDGLELTMHLIEGAKWSDGEPFTSEDVMFTWEDNILDENVNSWTSRSSWQINGQDINLEALDDYTIKWTFPIPYPVSKLFDMDFLDFSVCAAHVLKPFHPRYNSEADYDSYTSALPDQALPAVTMGPWVPVQYKTDEFMVLRRNPYYWKVDEEGRQLPYLNEVTFQKGESGVGRTLGTLAGSIDHTNLENPTTFLEAIKRSQEPDATFRIAWGPEMLSFPLELNLSLSLGVENDRDLALRQLFRDLRFRRALAQAIDGDGVAQAIIRGPFLRAFPGGLYPGAAEYDRNEVVYYPYAPDTSKALLADLGFEDTDGNGILNWTTGPLAGDDLVISLAANQDAEATGQIAQAIVPLLAQVGIKANVRTLQSTAMTDAEETGKWEARIERTGQEYGTPFTRCRDLAPVTKQTPAWHREGSEPRQLLDFEKQLVDIVNQFCVEPDSNKRAELMKQYEHIYTENLYVVGTVIGRYGLALAKRFKNVPVGAPPFYYQWTWGNVQPDQIWVAPEDQLPETLPETIPVYNK